MAMITFAALVGADVKLAGPTLTADQAMLVSQQLLAFHGTAI
jgi:hypothetical protein